LSADYPNCQFFAYPEEAAEEANDKARAKEIAHAEHEADDIDRVQRAKSQRAKAARDNAVEEGRLKELARAAEEKLDRGVESTKCKGLRTNAKDARENKIR
jgi:hypothetical protein